jgi:hypothetical protein
MLDKCDHAGIFKFSSRLVEFSLGKRVGLDEIKRVFNDRVEIIDGEKIYLSKYLQILTVQS